MMHIQNFSQEMLYLQKNSQVGHVMLVSKTDHENNKIYIIDQTGTNIKEQKAIPSGDNEISADEFLSVAD